MTPGQMGARPKCALCGHVESQHFNFGRESYCAVTKCRCDSVFGAVALDVEGQPITYQVAAGGPAMSEPVYGQSDSDQFYEMEERRRQFNMGLAEGEARVLLEVWKLRRFVIAGCGGTGDESDWFRCLVCDSRWRGDEQHTATCVIGKAQRAVKEQK